MQWLWLALGAAFFSALARVLIKVTRSSDNETIVFSRYFYALIPALIFLIIAGWQTVPQEFYKWVGLAALFDVGAIAFMTLSVNNGPFSRSLPMLSFTPIFVLLTGFLFLGEKPSVLGALGILVIVAGAYWLSYGDHQGILGPFKALYYEKGPRYMLFTALLFSFLGVFWKKAVLIGGLPMAISLGTFVPTILVAGFFAFRGQLREMVPDRQDFWKLALIGISTFGIMFFVLSAFETGFVSYVISIKRFSIILGVVAGAVFFNEKKPFRHIVGSLIMVGGAVLISLS
ncbi:MAG: DMT family transporter [Candidatus Pacearchaeota archaeon]